MSDFEKFLKNSTFINNRSENYRDGIAIKELLNTEGTVLSVHGALIEAYDFKVSIGIRCLITNTNGQIIEAEVIGFKDKITYLMATSSLVGLVSGSKIISTGKMSEVSVSLDLIGRIMDANGHFLDNLGPIMYDDRVSLHAIKMNPLLRTQIDSVVDVGIRMINACLPVGKGQRLGVYGPRGSGKTTLLAMMAKFSNIKYVVIALIGLSSCEVEDYIRHHLGEEGLRRAVVIVATQEDLIINRIHAAMRATSIAEYFRQQNKDVLLVIDSLTQFVYAQRDIALLLGEQIIAEYYSASVLYKTAELIERAGCTQLSNGSITACYAISTHANDAHWADHPFNQMLSIALESEIVLSPTLAAKQKFPAIDIEASRSKLMQYYISPEQFHYAQNLKNLYIKYKKLSDSQFEKEFFSFLLQQTNVLINFWQSVAALEQFMKTMPLPHPTYDLKNPIHCHTKQEL